jgi:concentrative nucleoside transporter, CNT family
MEYLRALGGLVFIIAIGFIFSSNRKAIDWKLILVGILLQIVFGLLIAKVEFVQSAFEYVSAQFITFLSFAQKGAEFLYGDLAKNSNDVPGTKHNLGFLFAFQTLPSVIFFSAVSAGLYHLGILQRVVYGFAWVMTKTMRLSGSESLSVAGDIFMGQTEAPLLVRPFIPRMTTSELHCLMVGGMATIAGSVFLAFVSFLGGGDPVEKTKFATHLLTASIMSAPAAVVLAKLFLPETQEIDKSIKITKENVGVNLIHSVAIGAADGLRLALNIGAMLLAFIAVIYALNWILVDFIGDLTGLNAWVSQSSGGAFTGFSLQYILGQVFRIFAFLIGVDWHESIYIGSLLGQKMVMNEFIAYYDLGTMKATGLLSEKSVLIATYALCGFANFSSIAIQIGGTGGMAPSRQADISRLGLRAMFAATLATLMTATIAGALFS